MLARPRSGSLVARLLHLPSLLYGAGFGWALGHGFLALSHRGRRSGVLADYEHRNRLIAPVVRAMLGRLAAFRYDGSPDARGRGPAVRRAHAPARTRLPRLSVAVRLLTNPVLAHLRPPRALHTADVVPVRVQP